MGRAQTLHATLHVAKICVVITTFRPREQCLKTLLAVDHRDLYNVHQEKNNLYTAYIYTHYIYSIYIDIDLEYNIYIYIYTYISTWGYRQQEVGTLFSWTKQYFME